MFEVTTGSLLNVQDLVKGTIPRVSVKSDNNGILGYFDTENMQEARHCENFISVNFFGDTFYHPYKASLEMKVHILKLKNYEFTKGSGLFIASVIKRVFLGRFDYGNQLSSSKLKNEDFFISLPTYADSQIAFDFMESYIQELEEERIQELEAYLLVAGLKDTKLTEQETQALQIFAKLEDSANRGGGEKSTPPLECENFANIKWQEFRIGDLFEIKPTKAYKMTNATLFESKGNVPVVTNSSLNNGISGYVSLEPTEKGNMITYSDTTTSEGIFYQPRAFVGYSHIQGLYPLRFKDNWNKYSLLYIVGVFRKASLGKFDYGNKFNRNIAKEMNIVLPVYADSHIAFDFIESFIKALEKENIKNVVEFSETKIKAYKKVTKSTLP